MWKVRMVFLINVLSHLAQAHDPITLNVENTYYDIPTNLTGIVHYKTHEKEEIESFSSQTIPAKLSPLEKAQHTFHIPQKAVTSIAFFLTTVRENSQEDLEATIIASGTFTPKVSTLSTLDIIITWQTLNFKPTYKLPPKFLK